VIAIHCLSRGRPDRAAVRDDRGTWTYAGLAAKVETAAARLGPLEGRRVGLTLERSRESVATFLGVLRAGGVAVPFSLKGAAREIEHVTADAGISRTIAPADQPALLEGSAPCGSPPPPADAAATILYTSGTTGRPKGVVHTHAALASQVDVLHRAWEWSEDDRLLHVLPLHHVHGLVNGLLGCLRAGAELRFAGAFEAPGVWDAFASGEATVFYAVPTIYHQLAEARDAAAADVRRRWTDGTGRMRLLVSGSAALPARLWQRWREITGQPLLERYGMTEIGMALSNPYRGQRRPGTAGRKVGRTTPIVLE
jgi:malonyl-CoA/methylmalonyl-CoA synthetase